MSRLKTYSPLITISGIPSTGSRVHESKVSEERRTKLKGLFGKIDKDFCIEKRNLRTKELIGKGNFGEVRKGCLLTPTRKNIDQKIEVAVKVLKNCEDEKTQDDFIKEAISMQELRKIRNVNIVTPMGICLDIEKGVLMIVTELAPLGALPKYLEDKKERIGVDKLLQFTLQIANGMEKLESLKFLHRDLALRNILVATEDQVKICDFGLSRLSDYYKASTRCQWPTKWYAPESLAMGTFTTKSDVWSFGVTMWEMFSFGAKPYHDIENSKILDHILEGNRLAKPENCPHGMYQIMQQCWDEDSMVRPSFFYLLNSLIPNEIHRPQTFS